MNAYYVAFCTVLCFGHLQVGQSKVPNNVGEFCEGRLKKPVYTKLTDFPASINTATLEAIFSQIPKGQRYDWNVAKNNMPKNRLTDNLAYDRSRVKLATAKPDYINANFVPDYKGQGRYIATQGPLKGTANDFWKMVWENKASRIVMLTNLMDHGNEKCFKYWPDKMTSYGNIEVIPQESVQHSTYILRKFKLKHNKQERIVSHYHFTVWPDFGTPTNAETLFNFVKDVRNKAPARDGPLVVHCSGGMGRTGTFILVDSMIEQADKLKEVDFAQQLCRMRQHRVDLVENLKQYLYAHKVVALWAENAPK